MKKPIWIVLPCLLFGADPPLTLEDVLARSRVSIERLNADAVLAEGRRQVKEVSGILRESPLVSVSAGPRTNSARPSTTDQTIEIDAPLMLNRVPAHRLASSLDVAAEVFYSAAGLENRLTIQQAFLDAWMAEQIETIRAEDYSQVLSWIEIARARSESGADPAFQLELVKGELLKSHMDLEEAKRSRAMAWVVLQSLSDLPDAPQSLDYHQDLNNFGTGGNGIAELESRYRDGALRRSAIARQNVEMSQINLQAAISNSRWSFSTSHTKESDDRITKIGFAYRFPRLGESSAIKAEQRARTETARRSTELALADLDIRFTFALQAIESIIDYPDPPDIEPSLEALTLRLVEGKDQPSEAIPMRRQFLEYRIAKLQRLHFLYLAHAELLTLTSGNKP